MVEYLDADGAAPIFLALGHPVRCDIVERLRGGERRITDLAAGQGISFAAISKHVAVLERAGVVRRRVDGRTHRISIDPRPLALARSWLDGSDAFWAGRLDALAATVEPALDDRREDSVAGAERSA